MLWIHVKTGSKESSSSQKNNSKKGKIMTCKGICEQYKMTKGKKSESWYRKGGKRCTTCTAYIEWDGLWCPCCGYMLRNKPKGNQYKKNLQKPRID